MVNDPLTAFVGGRVTGAGLSRLHGFTFHQRAGGIFLTIGILAGFAWGIAAGNPMKGILIGTALGALAALLMWLLDRRS